MRIGLLGGSFDPPHNAHLAVAQAVLHARKLDRVDLLVTGRPPHKDGKSNKAEVGHRLAMARIAADVLDEIGVEDCETTREGRSYTVDTLRELTSHNPENKYTFIIGGDMLADLPNWKEPAEIMKLAQVVPVFRPGHTAEVFDRLGDEWADQLKANVVEMALIDISSTKIREAVAAGESISQWVPPAVEAYIRAHGLYRP